MFSFGFCLETALDDGDSWVGGPGSFSGMSAPLWFFWTHIQVVLVGKANCCTLQSQDLLLQEQLYNHLGMIIIVFRCDGVALVHLQ